MAVVFIFTTMELGLLFDLFALLPPYFTGHTVAAFCIPEEHTHV